MSVASEVNTSFSLVSDGVSEVSEHDNASQVGEEPIASMSEKTKFPHLGYFSGTPTRRTVFIIGVLLGAVLCFGAVSVLSTQSSSSNDVQVYVCDNGWSYFDGNGKCYKRFPAAGFYEAHYKCQKIGAQLTSVHNYDENHFLTDIGSGYGSWSVDRRNTAHLWAKWYKNDGRCVSLVGEATFHSKGYWQPESCTTAHDFICSKPSNRLCTKPDRVIGVLALLALPSIFANVMLLFHFNILEY